MRSIILALLLSLFGFSVSALAQAPSATPTPAPADPDDVVKITTTLIQIDVTITDKKGKVITDIRPDEIEIYENDKKQKITNFSFVSNLRSDESSRSPVTQKDRTTLVPPPTTIRPEKIRRTVALVVDDITLSFSSTFWVKKALKKFVDEQMQEGDLVAIIRTAGGVGALQQFTNDRRQLYAAIDRLKFNLAGTARVSTFEPIREPSFSGGTSDNEPGQKSPDDLEREQENERSSFFKVGTLGAMRYIVRGMQELPGRKSIILLSDGLEIFSRTQDGRFESSRLLDAVQTLIDAANRASVVIYSVDARGLEFTGLTAADNTIGRSLDQIEQQLSNRRNELFDTQDGLQYLSRGTGGFAILNNNDLSDGIRKVLDDQSYYLVGYQPDEETFDPKSVRFNQLKIKVTRPGTNVRYRSRFFGISDEKIVRPQPKTPEARLIHALISPFAINDIELRLNALYYNTPTCSVIRSLVHVKAGDLNFTDEPNGKKKAAFEIVATTFGDNGVPVEQRSGKYTLELTSEQHARFTKGGFVHTFAFPVKKPGAYQLRLAFRDSTADKLGSAHQFVEVPNLKKERLVLSGVVLENIEAAEWRRRSSGAPAADSTSSMTDTSLRRFKPGTILNYGFVIYNAKRGPAGPNLSYQTRVFHNGKPVFEGKPQPVVSSGAAPGAIEFTGALALGETMEPGDYVLQVIIVDALAKEKRNTASQFVQFELVE